MLIALHGRLQAGKDTTYERIKYYYPNSERIAFADPLKDSAAALFGINRVELELMKVDPGTSISIRVPLDAFGYRYRTVTLTGREYLQRYGTESHRDVFGQDFWVNQTLSKVREPNVNYVITDCRFPNEAEAITDAGGFIIHVVGPDGKAEGGHASEQALDEDFIDFEIDNSIRDDHFANLDNQVREVMEDILHPMIVWET